MIWLAQIPLAQSHLEGPNGLSGEADWVEVIEEEVQAQKPDKQTKSLLLSRISTAMLPVSLFAEM